MHKKSPKRSSRLKRLSDCKNKVGSCCKVCGYDRCQQALELHHKNPQEKSFDVSDAIYHKIRVSDEDILIELNKCVLLCANCHRELHYGVVEL